MKRDAINSTPQVRGALLKLFDGGYSKLVRLVLVLALFCSACSSKESTPLADIKFDKSKWNVGIDGNYSYRKQMIKDLLKNYQWAGLKKDSIIETLGDPDGFEEGNLLYEYERKPFLGGIGTKVEGLVFELNADSTVRLARLNDKGWD